MAGPSGAPDATSAIPAGAPGRVPQAIGPAVPHRFGLPTLLPLACAVHCMLTPLLVAFTPAFGAAPAVEWVLLGASIVVAVFALRRGARFYRNGHVWSLAGVGVALWTLSLLGVFAPVSEEVTSPAGGMILAAGLFLNGRLSHRHACRDCGCPMH